MQGPGGENKNKETKPTDNIIIVGSFSQFSLPFLLFQEEQYMAALHRLHLISLN